MSSSNSPPKSKVVAALLCFFLGFLGVHRFYECKAYIPRFPNGGYKRRAEFIQP
ncbi:NINE protein [Spirulina major]|uniref:NINE protein n=1 Tax=Spirulina major TaxID=270636 RepID=UPI0009FCD425